nr:transposase [Rubrobacter xylanophilus]
MAQEVLLDNPDFLREIIERVLQEVLEAEMTEHVGRRFSRAHRRS